MIRINFSVFLGNDGNLIASDTSDKKISAPIFNNDIPETESTGVLKDAITEKYKSTGAQTSEIELDEQQEKYSRAEDFFIKKNNQEKAGFYHACLPDKGNGNLFDNTVRQISGACVLCAGLNSLKGISDGQQLINKNYTKDNEKGLFAIRLEEAENNNGKNIFIYSEKEVIGAQSYSSEDGLVSGDGDVTAVALAFKDYLGDEVFTQKGLPLKKFYEVISGQKAFNINEKEKFFTKGITYIDFEKNQDLPLDDYFEKIRETAQNKTGATVLSVGVGDKNHAISVVGCDK